MKLQGISDSGIRRIAQEVERRECPFYEAGGIGGHGKGWHWTSRENAEKIMREGLGTQNWTPGEHHAGYMYCELPYEYQDILDEKYGHPSEWKRNLPDGHPWFEEVEELLKEAHPNIHMACVGLDPEMSSSYGEVAIVVDLEAMSGVVEGFSFSDTTFGDCLLLFDGKIPVEFLEFYDPQREEVG